MRRMMLSMSQTKLGDAPGLTFQQVQKYEKGTNRISASRLQHISHILQVPVSFFFEGAPTPPEAPIGKGAPAPPLELRERLPRHFGWPCAHQSVHADQRPGAPSAHRPSRPRDRRQRRLTASPSRQANPATVIRGQFYTDSHPGRVLPFTRVQSADSHDSSCHGRRIM
jgi:transcriptional regulator with XRE-family HTH domain